MAAAPWFKIYSKELLADPKTKLLSHDQLGKLLLLWAWANEDDCCIPADPEAIGCLLGIANRNQMVKQMVWIRRYFVPVEGDESKLISLRLLAERKAYEDKCAKLKANGSRGGRPRKPDAKPNGYPDGLANGNQMASEEGREKKEKETPPTPPSGEQGAPKPVEPVVAEAKPKRKRRTQQEILAPFPEGVRDVVNTLGAEWHRQDPDGRPIDVRPEDFGEAVSRILAAQTDLTPEVLIEAGRAYLGSPRRSYKAPQWFFGVGKPDDPAQWVGYVRGVLTRQQREAQQRALPLAAGE